MKKTPTVAEMNRTIHEFMKGKWKLVKATPGGHLQIVNYTATSFANATKVLKAGNKHQEIKYKVVPHLKDYQFHYHYSFDALMPAVKKIAKFIIHKDWKKLQTAVTKWKAITLALENADIRRSHSAVYEFIQWYNLYTSK